MAVLVFIRHAETLPVAGIPAHLWQLTEQGAKASQTIAAELLPYALQAIYTSTEAKAIVTGTIIAQQLAIPCQTVPDLEETHRAATDLLDRDAFQRAVHRAMQHPAELLFGDETFAAARSRFLKRTRHLLQAHPDQSIALVSHGRILSMVMAVLQEREPFTVWDTLRMPDYIVFQRHQIEPIMEQHL
jgi:broad specificity phosphatase PhoE